MTDNGIQPPDRVLPSPGLAETTSQQIVGDRMRWFNLVLLPLILGRVTAPLLPQAKIIAQTAPKLPQEKPVSKTEPVAYSTGPMPTGVTVPRSGS